MNTTTAELMEALKTMTTEERIAFLRTSRPELFQAKQVISFGKAPKDGWKESDRVAK